MTGLVPDQQDSPALGSGTEGSSVELDDEIRVERDEEGDEMVQEALPIDSDEIIGIERAAGLDVVGEEVLPLKTSEEIRVEKRSRPYRLPLPASDDESSEEAEKNDYKIPFPNKDSSNKLAAVNVEDVRPMRRDLPSRTIPRGVNWYKIPVPEEQGHSAKPGPGKRNSPSRPARTPSPRIPSWYKIPIAEGDTTYKLPIKEIKAEDTKQLSEPNSETIRAERRDEAPVNPLITPAPEIPVSGDGGKLDTETGIRPAWTTPDFLTSFFPLFITLACSCLISSAAPVVTSSVTEVTQLWNYTTVSLLLFFCWGGFWAWEGCASK